MLWNLTASHLQATLSKLLTYCVLRSTQPPTPGDGKWVVAYGLRGEGLLRRWYVCMLHRGSNSSLAWVMDGRIMCHGTIAHSLPISCQFRDCKALLSMCSSRSSAISSTRPLPLSGQHSRTPGKGVTETESSGGGSSSSSSRSSSSNSCTHVIQTFWIVLKKSTKGTMDPEGSVRNSSNSWPLYARRADQRTCFG